MPQPWGTLRSENVQRELGGMARSQLLPLLQAARDRGEPFASGLKGDALALDQAEALRWP